MIEDKVLNTIRDRNMLSSGDKVVVAFSGGIDSTALIYILNSLSRKLKIKLFAAHLNHQIRGKDADGDALFVKRTSDKLGIPCFVEKFDVPGFARQEKLNLEDAARRIRYEFLERIAAKTGSNRIALAHTADDNIETFLMRLIRGTGMKGLEGIPPVRDKIIRPMIELYRSEIEQYLSSKKITARIDKSNYETKYLRNRVRRNLIPALESYNPNIRGSLIRAISAANTIQDFVESKAKDAFKNVVSLKTNDEIRIDIKEFLKTDPMLKGEVLRLAIEHVKKDLTDISFVHIDDIIDQLGKKRAEIDLPGIYAIVNKGMLSISRQRPQKSKPAQFMRKLEIPGEIRDESGGLIIEADIMDSVPLSELHAKNPYQAFLDYDKIAKPLIVRNRREGDAFSPLGLKGSKKLQDIFVDEKIDIDERDRIPVVEDGSKIVWVVGYRMAEEAKVTPKTKKVVKLSAKSINRR